MESKQKKLTHKQTKFVEHYLANGGNGVNAARAAGYRGNDATLAVVASENLRKPNIASRARARVEGTAANADEVLALLANHLRGGFGELAAYFRKDGFFDLAACAADGHADIIKKIQIMPVNQNGKVYFNVQIEIYDAQAAAGKLINVLGLKEQPCDSQRDEARKRRVVTEQMQQLSADGFGREEIEEIFRRVDPEMLQYMN